MAGTSSVEEKCVRVFVLLMSAFCEWSLIAVLLVNAVIAYIATRFARFCRLPPPCIICSRLDYIITGGERKNFYRNLFCHDHKMEISSTAYCHCHRKLVDSQNMCEICLLSAAAATGKMSRPVFGFDLEDVEEDAPDDRKEEDLDMPNLGTTRCSCCSELFSLHSLMKAMKAMRRGNINGGVSDRRARKRAEKIMDSPAAHAYDLLSHAGYSELNMSSRSESEGMISGSKGNEDGGYSRAPPRCVKDIKEEPVTRSRSQIALPPMEDMVPERLIHPNPDTNAKPEEAASISKTEEVDWVNGDEKKDRSEDSSERTIEQVPPEGSAADGVSGGTNLEGVDGNSRLSSASAGGVVRTLPTQKSLEMLDQYWNEITASSIFEQPNEGNTSVGLHNIAKKLIEMEMNSLSLDREMDEESSVEKLKQQLEEERKSKSSLYKELDEERKASALAVNEAMTMINRLQEEKAAIQMEALQYLRMLEEQSELDREAIQKLNDQLTDREKELLDMEADVEGYRSRYGELEGGFGGDRSEAAGAVAKTRAEMVNATEEGTDYAVKDVMLGFEEEKTQIAECLRRLEEKVLRIEGRAEKKPGEESEGASANETESSPAENELLQHNTLHMEIFKLSERLFALDADREFIGHAINVLRYGSDGVRLVQEIARYLEELRRYPKISDAAACRPTSRGSDSLLGSSK